MLYTIFMRPKDSGQRVFQAEGNDLKDALVQWAEESRKTSSHGPVAES